MKKIVIGFSGGMDSATLLGGMIEHGGDVQIHCCTFYYGSKHNKYEIESAKKVIEYFQKNGCDVIHKLFDISTIFAEFKSDLLLSGGEIPEGHYNDANMKKTVVPGRNLIIASILAGYAESIGADLIALGVHSGDHHIYPDCRPDFLFLLRDAILQSTELSVKLIYPFVNDNKTTILQEGVAFRIPVPYHLTRTCYKDQELSCGKCGSCQERLEAFKNINLIDPIQYE